MAPSSSLLCQHDLQDQAAHALAAQALAAHALAAQALAAAEYWADIIAAAAEAELEDNTGPAVAPAEALAVQEDQDGEGRELVEEPLQDAFEAQESVEEPEDGWLDAYDSEEEVRGGVAGAPHDRPWCHHAAATALQRFIARAAYHSHIHRLSSSPALPPSRACCSGSCASAPGAARCGGGKTAWQLGRMGGCQTCAPYGPRCTARDWKASCCACVQGPDKVCWVTPPPPRPPHTNTKVHTHTHSNIRGRQPDQGSTALQKQSLPTPPMSRGARTQPCAPGSSSSSGAQATGAGGETAPKSLTAGPLFPPLRSSAPVRGAGACSLNCPRPPLCPPVWRLGPPSAAWQGRPCCASDAPWSNLGCNNPHAPALRV